MGYLDGFLITIKKTFAKGSQSGENVTSPYVKDAGGKREKAVRTHGRHVLNRYEDGNPRHLPWEDWSDAEKVHPNTSAWMRATAPSGDADFEGIVAWAGELGWGERAPEGGQPAERAAAEAAAARTQGHGHGGGHH